MGCVEPQRAWRRRDGKGVTFNFREGWSDKPLEFKCGRCLGCKRVKAQAWALRIVHESQMHKYNCFLTLTIDDEHLPDDNSLDIKHWQLFAKRLRHKAGPFRHFYSGEYGTKYDRPHYHACIFGLDMRRGEDADFFPNGAGDSPLWRSKTLDEIWGMGHVAIGELEYGSAQYTAKYLVKSEGKVEDQKRYQGRKPEYISMSRNPGIGAKWIEKFKTDAFGGGFLAFDGKRHAVPKFYERVLTDLELRAWREKNAKLMDKFIASGETSWQRRDVKEMLLRIEHQNRSRAKESFSEGF